MGPKKKRRKEEARIRAGMAELLASAAKASDQAPGRALDAPSEAHPSASARRTRGPQKAPTKQPVSIRLDRDVVAELRRGGRGWQTRLNELLRDALSLDGDGGG
ncbi:MAG: BrnA antitoxin family protein [Pseudomonadota bacterium]